MTDAQLTELLDRVFDVMEGSDNAAFVAVGRMLLAVALDAAPPEYRNKAGDHIRKVVEELVASRRIH